MILIVNLNLAVDRIIQIDNLRPGRVHRSKSTLRQAGGKGVNVARVLKTLNERCLISGFLGGRSGEFIACELQAEGLEGSYIPIRNESRTCLILAENGRQTVINEPGPVVDSDELMQFTGRYLHLLEDAELVLITGSLPLGLSDDTYADFISRAHQAGKRVLLDCSSRALSQAIRARPFMVKINNSEAGELLGRSITDLADAAAATSELQDMGATHAMITLGEQGAVLAFDKTKYKFTSPAVRAGNSVGSGDAVMAGVAAGLLRGLQIKDLGILAVAAGAANALHGSGHCTAEEISQLQPQVHCSEEEN